MPREDMKTYRLEGIKLVCGDTMEHNIALDAADNSDSIDELRLRMAALRTLVCDLLKTNQELRLSLCQVKANTRQDPLPDKLRGTNHLALP
jgi:hypothetical protein